jgi:hypothetical protein
MAKLWTIGDSFWTRNVDMTTGVKIPGSWIETFANNINYEFSWGETNWSFSGASNDWLLYGLSNVVKNPKFKIDSDLILFGMTTFDRRMVSGNTFSKEFDRNIGWSNITEHRLQISNFDTMVSLQDKKYRNVDTENITVNHTTDYKRYAKLNKWNPELLEIEMDHFLTCTDHNWLSWQTKYSIDNAISYYKSKGINIILHRGCAFLFRPMVDEIKEYKHNGLYQDNHTDDTTFEWENKELFDVPSFYSGIISDIRDRFTNGDGVNETTAKIPIMESTVGKYHNHMGPIGNKIYGNALTQWYNDKHI